MYIHTIINIITLIYSASSESDDNRGLPRVNTRGYPYSIYLYLYCIIVHVYILYNILLLLYYDRLLTYAATQIDRKNDGSCVD